MTARRVVTLTCDRDKCREHYVGGAGHSTTRVRAEAAKLSGWRSEVIDTVRTDLCRWHS